MIDMNEEEIVRLFLGNGFQLSKNALDLASKDPERILSHLKKIKNRPFIITEQYIKKVLEDIPKKPINLKIIKEYTFDRNPVRVDDYVERLSSRYEKIKSLLLKQMTPKKLVSINKIGPKTVDFSIIGLVKEKTEDSVSVEDSTGETNLYVDENMKEELKSVLLDDVIGVKCKRINEKFYAEKFFYPDILSSREISKTDDEIQIAVCQSLLDLTNSKYKKLMDCLSTVKGLSALFIFSHVNETSQNEMFPKFNLIQISLNTPKLFQLNNIKILAIPKPFFDEFSELISSPGIFLSILKRRELFAQTSTNSHLNKNFILDEPPDIIISNFGGSFCQNYKGTTIISNSDTQKFFIVNLKTREVYESSI
jgi:hypothetical protein